MAPGKVARLAPEASAAEVKQAIIHDVNNALTGIYGGLDMAASTVAGLALPALAEDLAQIREAADRLLALSREVEASLAPPACPGGRSCRVLVVEDDANILDLIESALGEQVRVIRASTGREAIVALTAGLPFGAILTDLHLPDLDAPELVDAVAQLAPELARRVIVMTGGATCPTHKRFLAERESAVLYKPFSIGSLRGAIASVTGADAG